MGFLYEDRQRPGQWGFDIEGFWIDCPGGRPPVAGLVMSTSRRHGIDTLDDLLVALDRGPTEVPTCAEVQPFLDLETGITYDYQPSTRPRDLADRADIVADGRPAGGGGRRPLGAVRHRGGRRAQGPLEDEITASLELTSNPELGGGDGYVRLLPEGARVVAFLYEHPPAPSGYALGVEGFYVDCPGVDAVDGIGPDWAWLGDLGDIVLEVLG